MVRQAHHEVQAAHIARPYPELVEGWSQCSTLSQHPARAARVPLDADKKAALCVSGRTLSDACPQEIVNMDDADRHALLHDEKRRDG